MYVVDILCSRDEFDVPRQICCLLSIMDSDAHPGSSDLNANVFGISLGNKFGPVWALLSSSMEDLNCTPGP
jgi:hypothetical protein